MRIATQQADAKQWFGVAPPDLTLVARARASEFGTGPDWLYTYLRSFYRDETRPSGWNNVVFPNVGMPHVFWERQGEQAMGEDHHLKLVKPGKLSPEQYDAMTADLVGFLKYMGEPIGEFRQNLGVIVLIVLALLFVLSYALKREYWKDVH
jgi:ubiquinol-cytochrome c reductase cytochrome c1 subunit